MSDRPETALLDMLAAIRAELREQRSILEKLGEHRAVTAPSPADESLCRETLIPAGHFE